MERIWKEALKYSILLTIALSISACAVKFVDIDKSLPKLRLSEEQRKVVEPKMKAIKELSEKYDAEKKEFEEETNKSMGEAKNIDRSQMDRSQMQGKSQEMRTKREEFLKKRKTYLSAIKTHVAEIKAILNEKQIAIFEKMKMPELEMPEMSTRRPGGPGGGRGPGGGPGGGMF
jgi:hypothetical protein